MVNNCKLFTIIAKSSILDVARFMDPYLIVVGDLNRFLLRLDIEDTFLR